jgi:hypothetical protein
MYSATPAAKLINLLRISVTFPTVGNIHSTASAACKPVAFCFAHSTSPTQRSTFPFSLGLTTTISPKNYFISDSGLSPQSNSPVSTETVHCNAAAPCAFRSRRAARAYCLLDSAQLPISHEHPDTPPTSKLRKRARKDVMAELEFKTSLNSRQTQSHFRHGVLGDFLSLPRRHQRLAQIKVDASFQEPSRFAAQQQHLWFWITMPQTNVTTRIARGIRHKAKPMKHGEPSELGRRANPVIPFR